MLLSYKLVRYIFYSNNYKQSLIYTNWPRFEVFWTQNSLFFGKSHETNLVKILFKYKIHFMYQITEKLGFFEFLSILWAQELLKQFLGNF